MSDFLVALGLLFWAWMMRRMSGQIGQGPPGVMAFGKTRARVHMEPDTGVTFEDAAGIAHHAETMRLERITVIATDPEAPEDIRLVFARILRDERFHANAFARLAGERAIVRTRSAHRHGAEAIGFVSEAMSKTVSALIATFSG